MTGTAHIEAEVGDFAPFVLLPGDPLRARMIARQYLHEVKQVTNVRGMAGFTGKYKGRAISVMSSGMGMPSASIYCHELFESYGVKEIVRISSCGTAAKAMQLMDIVVAMGACTDSAINRTRFGGYDYSAIASFDLLSRASEAAKSAQQPVNVGNVFTTDSFYMPDDNVLDVLEKYQIVGIDMETAALYSKAAEFGANALAIMTVSDHLRTKAALTAKQRQSSFDSMIQLALNTFDQTE